MCNLSVRLAASPPKRKNERNTNPDPPAALSGPCVLRLEWKSGERHRQEGYEGRQGEKGQRGRRNVTNISDVGEDKKRERQGERVPRRVER